MEIFLAFQNTHEKLSTIMSSQVIGVRSEKYLFCFDRE